MDDNSLKNERIHLQLIDDASKGLDDVEAGRTKDARKVLAALMKRRETSAG